MKKQFPTGLSVATAAILAIATGSVCGEQKEDIRSSTPPAPANPATSGENAFAHTEQPNSPPNTSTAQAQPGGNGIAGAKGGKGGDATA